MKDVDILFAGSLPPKPERMLLETFAIHRLPQGAHAPDPAGAAKIRGLARGFHLHIDRALIESLPRLEIIANFGVGYDGIDLVAAADNGVVVTNTPDVLTEEVADTALGLLLMTVRELSAAERHLRAGQWPAGDFRLTGSMRGRAVGIVGLGRIGLAIARRLDAMQVPVAYHSRRARTDVPYRYFGDIRSLAEAVDTLVVVLPGNATTRGAIDAAVLTALGPDGVVINIGRGVAIDEPALIAALTDGTIRAAGLDVFANEPHVPAELMALPNAVLLPHVGSASTYTRDAMGQLVVDNLTTWFATGKPLTPVPETPVPQR